MAELTSRQKKDFAKSIYLGEDLTQEEIAERVGVKRQTVSRWIKEGNWERHKVSITITREEQLKNLYLQLSELNAAIAKKPEGERFANAAESDTISKISNAIKKMETDVGLADILSVFKSFVKWLRSYDISRSKEIVPLLDAYIKSKL
ncbi:helix-turn-helix domain-containing protein [Bacteroides faecis]|uniref:helix-turn-helix domain-containing protein n=1 Tax=Bacteroides faecis TaxID=674529 RepID=UPI002045ADBD|nr:helix-turn-helix domain-containing protein [Bacteroides faecis]DAO73151.1 MAG TPA: Transcriptional regulator, contains sigma factor-related N-terminal domain [Caudoviricetes sp.]